MLSPLRMLAGAIALVAMLVPAHAKTIIKAGIEATEGSLVFDVMKFFQQDIERRTAGELEFQLTTGGMLGKDIDVINGLRLGTHEMTMACSPVQSVEPTLGLFEAPFLFKSRDEVKRVVFGPIGQEVLGNLEKKGIVGLSLTELGFRQITNNVRPIRTPADLKGLKIRIPNTPFRRVTFESLGANASPVAFGETYSALRQGVIDGQENPLPSIYGAKFHEVQKYVTMANYLFTPCVIMASPSYFKRWPANLQEAVRASAKAAGEFSFTRGAELDAQYIEEMKKTSEVNAMDITAFREVARPLWDQLGQKVGGDLMKRVIAEVAK
jgi:TRAP-type transport system periplasmic protein